MSGTLQRSGNTRGAFLQRFQDESSENLLQAVIRKLSQNPGLASTDTERTNIEQSFRESDVRLDGLLNEHYSQLTTLIEAFTDISTRLDASRKNVRGIKENLSSCKNLLQCKREDLRKNWLDSLEQNTINDALEHIDEVRAAADKATRYKERRKYLHATNTILNALSLLRNDLSEVNALRAVTHDLETEKQNLISDIKEQLNEVIYKTSTSMAVMAFQRFGSIRGSGKAKGATIKASAIEETILSTVQEIIEDPEDTAGVEDRSHYLAILVECLAKLNVIPDVISEIRADLEKQLFDVIDRASSQSLSKLKMELAHGTNEDPVYLLDLLEFLFEQFRCVVHAHNVIIRHMKRIKQSSSSYKSLALYDITEVWIKVQVVIQKLLESYLNDEQMKRSRHSNVLSEETQIPVTRNTINVNDYFSRKHVRQKKGSMFSFSGTHNSATLQTLIEEKQATLYRKFVAKFGVVVAGELMVDIEYGHSSRDTVFHPGALTLICKPAVTNIVPIYKCIEGFTTEVEMAMGCDDGQCILSKYLQTFIKTKFNSFVTNDITSKIERETERFDSLKNLIDSKRQKELSSPRPLLQSTVTVVECVLRLAELMQGLPDCCDYFLQILMRTLEEYLETAKASYQGVVQIGSDSEQLVISATWATDDDISRFLRSLPNWQNVQTSGDNRMNISEDEMRALNLKESQILTSNLSDTQDSIPTQDILSDPAQLKLIASLQESMEWLTFQLERFLASIPSEEGETTEPHLDIPEIKTTTYNRLSTIIDGYKELSNTCLLVLHLEVRLHCFYHLMPMAKQSNYHCAVDDMDADSNVVNLNQDLTHIEELIKSSLQNKKFRYIFEGLGHLVSSLLINSVQYIKRINEFGVKKMCRNVFAIQQSLTNVTSNRELDLELARQYYELLNLSIEQMINVIMEQGSKFTELEYQHLMSLIKRSQPGISDEKFDQQTQKLKKIITEKQVYVV